MAQIEDFVTSPSDEFLDLCSKEQLLEIADHYKVDVGDRRRKTQTIKWVLMANLTEMGILPETGTEGSDSTVLPLPSQGQFSFEQQKELLLIQLEMERTKQQGVIEKERVEIEKGKIEMEKLRINLQREKVELVKEGKMDQNLLATGGSSAIEKRPFDLVTNLRLMPKFNEKEPETFFSLFERLADSRGWPAADLTVMLQCVLTGKAQDAYSALSVTDSLSYATVKAAVLKAYLFLLSIVC